MTWLQPPYTGRFNLPHERKETVVSFQSRLTSLLAATPPAALVLYEAPLSVAALEFGASRGVRISRDVSLMRTDPVFGWCRPTDARIHWAGEPVMARVLRRAAPASLRNNHMKQSPTPPKFVPGGTIGPAKG